jgi:O-antigen/teichoic acid export membrane protein
MLKRNIVANYVGNAWTALMGIAFVPMYVKYLGDEAYGVVGIAAAIQAYLGFLDAGLTPMLAREMSRFTGGAHSAEAIRSLMRIVELWAWSIGAVAIVAIWFAAPWIASDWLRTEALAPETVSHALRIMALVVGLRFIEGLYRSCLVGLQRQVTSNIVAVGVATVRGFGAVGVLAWWSPTLDAFFWWQGAVSLASAASYVMCTYSALPSANVSMALGGRALRAAWPFAKGMLLSSFLVLALTQMDKVLLSRLLDLADYGRYTVALVAAGCVATLAGPVGQAFYPRLNALHAQGQDAAFARAFHHNAQLVSVVVGTAGITLMLFADRILLLWTRDQDLVAVTATPFRLLVLGNILNTLMHVPYLAQLATGWTSISNRINMVAIFTVVPTLMLVVPKFGMTGAAGVWAALNASYVLVGAPLSFRRLLRGEQRRWYLRDLAAPIGAALAAGALVWAAGHWLPEGSWMGAAEVAVGAAAIGTAATLASPTTRAAVTTILKQFSERRRSNTPGTLLD